MSAKQILIVLVLALVGLIASLSAFVVQETEQVMVLQLGKVKRLEAEPGLKWRVPFAEQLIYFDKRILETDAGKEEIQSKDKKRLVVDSFTRWRIVDARKFFEAVRTDSAARARLNIIVNSNIRRALARHNLVDVVSGDRQKIMEDVLGEARKEAESLGIEIVDVRIKRADLPVANSRAVFNDMRTEREKEAKEIRAGGAEKAQQIRADAERQRTILLAEAQRDAQKIRGEGDAESIRISAEAFGKDPEFYAFIRSLEAYQQSLKDDNTMMVIDPSSEFFKYFKDSK